MKGDGNSALHLCPGNLRKILGVEDEEVRWSLGTGSCNNGKQHTCGDSKHQPCLKITSYNTINC